MKLIIYNIKSEHEPQEITHVYIKLSSVMKREKKTCKILAVSTDTSEINLKQKITCIYAAFFIISKKKLTFQDDDNRNNEYHLFQGNFQRKDHQRRLGELPH